MTVDTPCVEWDGPRDKHGYGIVSVKIIGHWKRQSAHRLAMARIYGWDAIDGFVVRHLCDNPPCVNPEHLRVGTQWENVQDMIERGRRHRTSPGRLAWSEGRCARGHDVSVDENVYVDRGSRGCRICYRANKRALRARQRGGPPTNKVWRDGKCSNGHDVDDPANVRIRTNGRRLCRACAREWDQKHRRVTPQQIHKQQEETPK